MDPSCGGYRMPPQVAPALISAGLRGLRGLGARRSTYDSCCDPWKPCCDELTMLRGLGDCATNPTDPVCQAIYDNGATAAQYGVRVNIPGIFSTGDAGPSTTPVDPGKMVDTSAPPPGTAATIWGGIPTWVKVLGIGAIAFVGYKKFVAKPKSAGVAGWFGKRRRR